MITLFKINEEGFLLFGEEIFVENDKNPIDIPHGFVAEPLPKDEKGFQLPMYKPKWNGTEWVEGATQEELDAIENTPKPLSEIEQLRLEQAQANAELVQLIMMMNGGPV